MRNSTGGALVIGALVVGLALGSTGVALGSGDRAADQLRTRTTERAQTAEQDHRSTESTPTPAVERHHIQVKSPVRETAHRAETEPAAHETTRRTEATHATTPEVHHPAPAVAAAAPEAAPCDQTQDRVQDQAHDRTRDPATHDSAHESTEAHNGHGGHD